MASEYKCDICGKPATVHITKIIDNKKVKIHLCSECAEKASLDAMNIPAEIFPKIKELEQQLISSHSSGNADLCPSCGASLSEILKGSRFSCPDCYAALGQRLSEILMQMHGACRHVGKTPKRHAPNAIASKALKAKALKPAKEHAKADEDIFAEELAAAMAEPAVVPAEPSADNKETLQKKLQDAISDERYEDAALLRDKLKSIS